MEHFVGRAGELAALDAEMQTVRDGQPRVVLIEGDAGIGKSSLLSQFLSGQDDVRLLRASGAVAATERRHQVNAQELAGAYLDALGRADPAAMLSLFSDGALVHSPLYGPTAARDFYPALFSDTAESRLTLRGVTEGASADGGPLVSIWFRFDWRLSGGREAPFDVVDMLALTADGRIGALHIVYDTAGVRPVFEQETGRRSWREPAAGEISMPPAPGGRLVELSHVIRAGMITYPGLPGPEITPHLTREASRELYAPGTEFAIGRLSLVGNTGTYLDSPYHRYDGGADLSEIPLARTADLPAVVVTVGGAEELGIGASALAALDVRGMAVLLHTGDDARFGSPAYAERRHYLTRGGAIWLAEHGAALAGIDALNIDDTAGGERPAHTLLLGAGIPVVEHLTGLGQLPPAGASFTAVPLRIAGFGSIPVRAFARLPG